MIFSLSNSYGQSLGYTPVSDCSNHNALIGGTLFDSLKYFTDTIYPEGIIILDRSKTQELDSIEQLLPLLGVESGSTFELVYQSKSIFDTSKVYFRYQQMYYGVKVDGAGYTVQSASPQEDPCTGSFLISAYIASGINVNVTPTIDSSSLKAVIQDSVLQSDDKLNVTAELVISPHLKYDCTYQLTWKTSYMHEGAKITWVDAHTNEVLRSDDVEMNLSATTETYGAQNLDDTNNGGTYSLISTGNTVRTYTFSARPSNPIVLSQWTTSLIPTTTDPPGWTSSVATQHVYQSHYVTTLAGPSFSPLGINFGTIHVACSPVDNAVSLYGSTPTDSYIELGILGGKSTALFDVVGHELGHTYMGRYIDYRLSHGNRTLQEAMADMFGTYIEAITNQQGTIDWIIGDDAEEIANEIDRDLENPNEDCFTDVSGNLNRYTRGLPLGHWFFLITAGDSENGIPALGINKAIRIVAEAIKMLPASSDYANIKAATIEVARQEFGICSEEAEAIIKAWDLVCVGPPANFSSCYTIEGTRWVCEEDTVLGLHLENYNSNNTYIWTFPFDWDIAGNRTGNSHVGTSLHVTDFPKYNYYPQYFDIYVYSPQQGSEFRQKFNVKLVDCNGDDPTCEEFNAPAFRISPDLTDTQLTVDQLQVPITSEKDKIPKSEHDDVAATLRVYDLMGILLYEGSEAGFFEQSVNDHTGVIFCAYFDTNGQLIRTKKILILK